MLLALGGILRAQLADSQSVTVMLMLLWGECLEGSTVLQEWTPPPRAKGHFCDQFSDEAWTLRDSLGQSSEVGGLVLWVSPLSPLPQHILSWFSHPLFSPLPVHGHFLLFTGSQPSRPTGFIQGQLPLRLGHPKLHLLILSPGL